MFWSVVIDNILDLHCFHEWRVVFSRIAKDSGILRVPDRMVAEGVNHVGVSLCDKDVSPSTAWVVKESANLTPDVLQVRHLIIMYSYSA